MLYALVGGWIMVECLIMLDWWPTYGWTGGAVLLVSFALLSMALTAIAQKQKPKPRELALYGGVAVVALIVLAVTA
jgi:multisubunit Na+/H+ antiporter MnhB subunit